MIFVYESRILTPARPGSARHAFDEDSNSSFVFNFQNNDKDDKASSETQGFTSSRIEILESTSPQTATDHSIIFIPEKIDVVNLVSSTRTETEDTTLPSTSKTPEVALSYVSIPESDEDQPKTSTKEYTEMKSVVVLEKLPNDLFEGSFSKPINTEKSQPLQEFLKNEIELLTFKSAINIENLALHGETSTSQRIQRLSLKKDCAPKRIKRSRRQSHVVTSSSDTTLSSGRKRKTYCTFCEEWVTDIKIHRKQHDVRSFVCEVCGKKYNMKAHLAQHFRKMHRDALL